MSKKIQLHYFEDEDELYRNAAEIIENELDAQEKVVGLATGETMISLYQKIKDRPINFTNVISFNLDEYIGLPPEHPNSYSHFMHENLFQYKKFKKNYIPNGNVVNLPRETSLYESLIKSHPIDLQILGVGINGHIGFNEPGTSFSSKTHVVTLASSTRQENTKYFLDQQTPLSAITMGIQTILSAKKIMLIALGEKKRPPLEALINADIDEKYPITALNLHNNVIVLTNIRLS